MWALVFMSVARFSEPQYVELYQSKKECMSLVAPGGFLKTTTSFCVPVAPVDKK